VEVIVQSKVARFLWPTGSIHEPQMAKSIGKTKKMNHENSGLDSGRYWHASTEQPERRIIVSLTEYHGCTEYVI